MYLIFDVETSDAPPRKGTDVRDVLKWPRLLQLGFALYDEKRNLIKEYNQLIKPNGKFVVADGAYGVHHISTETAELNGLDIVQVMDEFYDALDQTEFLIAHNINFDYGVLISEHIRNKLTRKSNKERVKICTMNATTDFCKIPPKNPRQKTYKWPTLIELHNVLFGYAFADAHDAIIDVRATVRCFWELVDKDVINLEGDNIYKNKLIN